MAGRKPVPTKLKVLRGNPGKRPLNASEPKARVLKEVPQPPDFMDEVAKAEWWRMGQELVDMGMLTSSDRAALIGYCISYARVAAIELELSTGREELVLVADKGGEYINPMVNIQSMALKQMKAYLTEFGMTPSSRTRIKVPDAPKEDPFENFLARGGLRSLPKVKK